MRLHHSATSPFVRKVMVTLHETGQLEQVELVSAAGNPVAPGTMPVAVNPLGKVPTLERPDGPAIYDSRVITRYLDSIVGGGLYPDGPRVWETLTLEAAGDGINEAAVLMVYERKLREEAAQSAAWVEGQWAKIARALDALEDRWLAHLAGRIDAGQIAVGCALGYLDFRHAGRNWRAGRPGVARWFEQFAERPSMVATRPVE
jgi:glutathione S-transferase